MSFGMVIGHNLGSMNALSALNQNSTSLQSALQKLSTGKRINSAADDAAGLAISQKMQSQINGLDQANRNAQDGISLIQTAEGALNETQSILQRMRTLAVQSSNDTNTTDDRNAMQQEIGQLTQEIDRIANTTQFNTKNLLNGGAGIDATVKDNTAAGDVNPFTVVGGGSSVKAGTEFTFTGLSAAKSASVEIDASAANNDITVNKAATISVNGVSVNLTAGMTGSQVASAINAVTGQSGVTATYTAAAAGVTAKLVLTSSQTGSASDIKLSGLTYDTTYASGSDTFKDAAGGNLVINRADGTSVSSNIASSATTDFNGVDAKITSASLTGVSGAAPTSYTASGNYITFHGGDVDGLQVKVDGSFDSSTYGTDTMDVKINANNTLNLQIGSNQGQTMNVSIGSMTSSALGVNNIDVTSVSSAENSISTLDDAIKQVSNERANLGAYQNRLEHTINNLSTSSDNLTTAESGITDTNMAQTMAEFTKDNVLQQAAVSMLAQANQQPQMVLKLLG